MSGFKTRDFVALRTSCSIGVIVLYRRYCTDDRTVNDYDNNYDSSDDENQDSKKRDNVNENIKNNRKKIDLPTYELKKNQSIKYLPKNNMNGKKRQ